MKGLRSARYRLICAALLFIFGLAAGRWQPAVAGWLSVIAWGVAGYDVLYRAARNIMRGRVFDENFLMAVATVGALALGEQAEAAAVMLFYQTGELFQDYAVDRSRRSIGELMDIRPAHANLITPDGPIVVDPQNVHVGQRVLVKPGERMPLDGMVVEGQSVLDTAALTGESTPRDVMPGDKVISGCINVTGQITVQVEKAYSDSAVARILELVENASSRKSRSERFITRFSAIYTPVVVVAAAALAFLPPLLLGQPLAAWVYRALSFLVVSCPCALVISIPLSFFGGLGGASRAGILVKGSNYLEALAKAQTFVFDKTGTLTKGVFEVGAITPQGISREALLELAALAESGSSHPIARSILEAYGKPIAHSRVRGMTESGGHGVEAQVDGREVLVGSARWLAAHGISVKAEEEGTVVYVAANGRYAGSILLMDKLKEGAAEAIRAIKALGVCRTAVLTGDSEAAGRAAAQALGIDRVMAGLLPQDKVAVVENLINQSTGTGVVFVGDGINDAPVLARADVGIAMGALGADAAIEAADVVIMNDRLDKLPEAVRIARKTAAIARQNTVFAIAVKMLVLLLSAVGLSSLWAAVFADVGVAFLAVLNAMRTMFAVPAAHHTR